MFYRILLVTLLTGAVSSQLGPFTKDFVKFLKRNFERNEYAISSYEQYGDNGTFGGKEPFERMELTHQPVLFVHGNSDSALYFSPTASGWSASVEYFKSQGFKGYELYGLTYGSRDQANVLRNSITCRNLVGIRRFIEAILAYTQADKIDIVAHSMGVSLARKAIQGGLVHLTEEPCDLGHSLAHKVDALIAIAGANYGMCMCLEENLLAAPACGQEGFTPGPCGKKRTNTTRVDCSNLGLPCEKDDYASVLQQINQGGKKEAAFIASIWSFHDDVLGIGNLAWGRGTSRVPQSDFTHLYTGLNHFQTKELSFEHQYTLVTSHTIPVERAWTHY